MSQHTPASRPAARPAEAAVRRSGTLKLYLVPADALRTDSPSGPAYAHFRLTRGFLDDLNRMLPIRMRIQLESEISKGRDRGRMDAPGTAFLWEFAEG